MRSLLVVAFVALTVAPAAWAPSHPEPTQRIVVTRETAATPPECGPADAAELLLAFAYDPTRLFVEPFLRFAVVGPEAFRAEDRAQALDYLRRTRPWRVVAVGVGPGDPKELALAATVEVQSRRYDAKIVLDCVAGTVHGAVLTPDFGRKLCGVPPPSDHVVACALGPNAFAERFAIAPTSARFRPACAPGAVRNRVKAILRWFNRGDGQEVARGFAPHARMYPYGLVVPIGQVPRFVATRFRAGDGWTATRLGPPVTATAARAIYSLSLEITQQGRLVASAGAKLVVDCRSGLVQRWVGPGIKPPQFAVARAGAVGERI